MRVCFLKVLGVHMLFPDAMNWADAKKACRALGKGWRLPTKSELNILYKNRKKIGGFGSDYYSSSTEYNNIFAWIQSFDNGLTNTAGKPANYYVRAVKSL